MIPNDSNGAPKAADPFFFIGDERDELLAGKKVAVAVSTNFLLKDGNRERGHGIPIHEIPLLRMLYSEGTIDPIPTWVPGVDRRRQLTQGEFEHEFERLSASYLVPNGNQTRNIFAEVFGGTPTEQRLNLHKKMHDVFKAWNALERAAMQRVVAKYPGRKIHPLEMHGLVGEVITREEMEELVSLVRPAQLKLDAIPLDEVTMAEIDTSTAGDMPQAPAVTAAPAGDAGTPEAMLIAALSKRGFEGQAGLELATLAIELPDGIPDDLLSRIAGMTKGDGSLNKAKAAMVRKVVEEWRSALPAESTT